MRNLPAKASRAAVFAGATAVVAAATVGAFAQQAAPNQPPRGWYKTCGKEQDIDICNVQHQVLAQTGQLLTAVQLAEFTGKVNRRVLQVSVPINRLLPAGVVMQIDANKPTKLDFTTCLQDRCVADVPLTDAIVGNLKKGSELTLTTYNFQNQPNPIKVSLEGFTGVYDGPGMQQADLAERRKATEDYIMKNQQKLADQLKEAQEKAKAGN